MKYYWFTGSILCLVFLVGACMFINKTDTVDGVYFDPALSFKNTAILSEEPNLLWQATPPLIVTSDGGIATYWIDGPVTYGAVLEAPYEGAWQQTPIFRDGQTATSYWNFAVAELGGSQTLVQMYDKILVKVSSDQGRTWNEASPPPFIDCSYQSCRNPALQYAGSDLYLVFVKTQPADAPGLYLSKSVDDGLTWSAPKLILSGLEVKSSVVPRLAWTEDEGLYVLYGDVFYRYSDVDSSLKPVQRLQTEFDRTNAQLAVSDDNIFLVSESREYPGLMLVKKQVTKNLVLNAQNFSPSENIMQGEVTRINDQPLQFTFKKAGLFIKTTEFVSTYTNHPGSRTGVMAVDQSNSGKTQVVLWRGEDGVEDVLYLTYSRDGGITWSKKEVVPTQGPHYFAANIKLLTEDQLVIVWTEGLLNEDNRSLISGPARLKSTLVNIDD